jgi:hypothetical protein
MHKSGLQSRRSFLGTIALGGIVLASGDRAAAAATGTDGRAATVDPPLFRFLQINDVHVQQEHGFTHPTYRDANRRARWLLANLANPEFVPPLDFVLLNGDMIHQGTLESNRDAFAFLRTLLPEFSVPYYPVVGNHEVSQHEGDPLWEEPYVSTYGDGRQFYSFVHKGVAFVIFNNAGTGEGFDERVYRLRHERLRAMLEQHAGTPTIVVCHIPVYPVRQGAVLAESFGFHSWRTVEPEIGRLLEGQPSVVAILSGHLHLTGMASHHGIPQIVFAGTASFPHDIGLVSVWPRAITVEALRLPSNLLVPETNIHGVQRHGRDYTDDEHPTYTQYLMGNSDERLFSIPREAG